MFYYCYWSRKSVRGTFQSNEMIIYKWNNTVARHTHTHKSHTRSIHIRPFIQNRQYMTRPKISHLDWAFGFSHITDIFLSFVCQLPTKDDYFLLIIPSGHCCPKTPNKCIRLRFDEGPTDGRIWLLNFIDNWYQHKYSICLRQSVECVCSSVATSCNYVSTTENSQWESNSRLASRIR